MLALKPVLIITIMKQHATSLLLFTLLACSSTILAEENKAEPKPWRLSNALNTPAWFEISGSHRTRYETLNNQFRAGGRGGDQLISFRTLLLAKFNYENFKLTLEGLDSRQDIADNGTPLNNTFVNTTELLQANLSWKTQDLINPEDAFTITGGRMTIDLGSRRLVGRNGFRNTINSFNGIDTTYTLNAGHSFRAIAVMPITRLPSDASSLRLNQAEFDAEDPDIFLWGIHYATTDLPESLNAEFQLLSLHESDTNDTATTNRQIQTPSFRIFKKPKPGEFDYELESALQFGTARSSDLANNTRDLNVFAAMLHAHAAYTWDVDWKPRLILQYDYATGDDDPNDGEWNRFDTLYGTRRIEYNPSGIYGAFARGNISTPGWRFITQPTPAITTTLAHRAFWLDSSSDAWHTSGVRDATGNSGTFIGNQLEAWITWDVIPQNVQLETGINHLFVGEFPNSAPNSPKLGDVTYFYVSTLLTF